MKTFHWNAKGRTALAGAFVLTATACPIAADEADAKAMLAAMSDYMTAAQGFTFDFDSTLDVVTTEGQIIGLASSGTVAIDRPGTIRATRRGGFTDIEMGFDGTTVTLIGHEAGIYMQLPIEGAIDTMIETLRSDYGVVLPAVDLLMADPAGTLMDGVTDIKDLGAGVIGGQDCDHIALRKADLDIQIWIAQGEAPIPCRYVLSTRDIAHQPQYTVQINNWRSTVEAGSLAISIPEGASNVDLDALMQATQDLPSNFSTGAK